MLSRSRNSFLIFATELPCSGDLENPGQLPVQEVLEGTDDCVLVKIFEISSLFMFSRSGNSFLIFLLSYHVRVTLKIKVNFRFRRYLKVLMILSYGFSQFLQYSMFSRSRNSLQDIPSELLCLGDQLKIQVNFRYKRYSKVLMIVSYRFLKFLHYLCFWGHRNPLPTFLLSYHVRVTLKIQVNFRFSGDTWFCLIIVAECFIHYLLFLRFE